jgi:phage-related protein (TIGR01555 family)
MGVLDSLMSFVSGLGTGRDKASTNSYVFIPLDKCQLEKAYRGDWLSRKVVDIPARDATRAWRRWFADKDQIEAIEAVERGLAVRQKVYRALQLGRLYGGSLLFFSDGTLDQALPLDIGKLGRDGLKYIHVFNRYQIGSNGEINFDIASPYFNQPNLYTLNTRNGKVVNIHPSRCIRFVGNPYPDEDLSGGEPFWGDSVLQATQDALRAAASSHQNVASLIEEAVVDIIKIPDLADYVATEATTAKLVSRWAIAAQMKSNNGALVLDGKEEYEQKQINFSALPDVIKVMLQVASGASDIPVTRLIGMSPSGLNATGDSDIRNYYDKIKSDQENDLRPALNPLDEAIIRTALGARPDNIYYDFNPLWQMTEKERAEISKLKAETAQIYVGTQLLPDAVLQNAVANDLTETETYPGFDAMLEAYQNGELEPLVEEDDTPAPGEPANVLADAAPRTLYVSRAVLNTEDIQRWAERNGIPDLVDDLHVTVIYSRKEFDWMKIYSEDWNQEKDGNLTIAPGGVRLIDILGPATSPVFALLFTSSRLAWRHEQIMNAGASSDYDDYQPHITLTKTPFDFSKIEAYQGKIVLGPEKFELIKEDK